MGLESEQTVRRMVLPLFSRAVLMGALLGAFVSAGMAGFSAIQAALYPEQFGLWGMSGGQIFFVAIIGFLVGGLAGLVTGVGTVAALWVEAAHSSSAIAPRSLTAGLGAGLMTVIYAFIVLYVIGTKGVALATIGVGLATVSGVVAASHTRRLVRRYQSTLKDGVP